MLSSLVRPGRRVPGAGRSKVVVREPSGAAPGSSNRATQAGAIERIRAGLTARRPHDVWQAFRSASPALDADGVRLQLVDRGSDGETVTRTYEAGQGPASGDGFVVRLKLRGDGRDRGWVEFGWIQSAPRLSPETDEALRLLCDDVSGARVGRAAEETFAKVLTLRR
jgi:hypothetical protein